jgi:hypothetical protein
MARQGKKGGIKKIILYLDIIKVKAKYNVDESKIPKWFERGNRVNY